MSTAAEKLAFLLEATHGPLWKGKSLTLNNRLQRIFGRLSRNKLKARRTIHFRWMKLGAKRRSQALDELCAALRRKFGVSINPAWIIDPEVSLIQFAARLGVTEVALDFAMLDLMLNRAKHEPDLLSPMGTHVRMRKGIWLVDRWTDEARTTRRSTCIFVVTQEMLKYRLDTQPRACHFAYLFTPFGGVNQDPTSRPGVTKYVGRGAYVDGSLEFHFSSVGRTPPDKADMRIMASDDGHTRYDGGYVSKNIDKRGRPGVRWIDLSFLDDDVSVESIDWHCAQYVRSADDLASGAKPTIAEDGARRRWKPGGSS